MLRRQRRLGVPFAQVGCASHFDIAVQAASIQPKRYAKRDLSLFVWFYTKFLKATGWLSRSKLRGIKPDFRIKLLFEHFHNYEKVVV
jgi:hypothetical protein